MNNSNSKSRQGKVIFLIGCYVVIFSGFLLRWIDLLSRGLEYDEIWTFTNYSMKNVLYIFTELNTPNNHVLNSLFIKLFHYLTGNEILSIRGPAFIAGILQLPLMGFIVWRLSKNLYAVFFSILFISSSGVAMHYSQTGRGYSLQTFFISLFIAAIIHYEQKNLTPSNSC